MSVVEDAKGGDITTDGRHFVRERSHPEMYLLLPLALPIDVATSPVQLFYLWTFKDCR